jgi:Tfp pilus assembly protein PilF
LPNNGNHYVSVLETDPLLLISKDWRSEAFQWFRKSDLETFVAFKEELEPEDNKHFKRIIQGDLSDELIAGSKERKSDAAGSGAMKATRAVKETIRPQEIVIETKHIGEPHLVRVSYHPNWHVEGADRVYPVSPSFMLIFPTQEQVRLYFGPSFPNYLGYVLTLLGVVIILCHFFWPRRVVAVESQILNWACAMLGDRFSDPAFTKRLLRVAVLAAVCAAVGFVLLVQQNDATTAYKEGFSYYKEGDYETARQVFQEAMREFPYSPVIDQTTFHYAVSYYREEKWGQALKAFEQMAEDYPESRMFSEVLYHIAMCRLRLNQRQEAVAMFNRILEEFPKEIWAENARQRLRELGKEGREP